MGLRMPDAQQNAMADYGRSAGLFVRRPPDGAQSKTTRIDREVLEFIDVQSNHAFFKKDDRPENTVYMSNEDTLLNNGSLIGVDLSRVFHIHDFAMVSAVMGAQWTATSVRTVLPLDKNRTEFVTHALVTEVLPTSVRLFSRCLQKPIDAAVGALPRAAVDDAGSPVIRPHQTVVARAHKVAGGEAYVAVAVEILPLHCGKGVIYLVREEFSVILYDEPPGNERLPFRYVLAPNDVIKAGGLPLNDWYGRRVEFAACVDQPDGSEEFMEGRRYKAVQVTIVANESRTMHYRSRGVVYSGSSLDEGRDDVASSFLRSANPSTPSDVLSLEDKVLDEWRMVQRAPDDADGPADSSFEAVQRAPSIAAAAASASRPPQSLHHQQPIDEHLLPFTSSNVFASMNRQRADASSPLISAPMSGTTEPPSASDRSDQPQQQQQQQQNSFNNNMNWDDEAERLFADQIRQAEEESLRLAQRPATEMTGNPDDDELQRAIAISIEEERLRLERLREQEERDLAAALNASCLSPDEQLEEVLALSRREANAFDTYSSMNDYDRRQAIGRGENYSDRGQFLVPGAERSQGDVAKPQVVSNGMMQNQSLADVDFSLRAIGGELYDETSIKETIESEYPATSKQSETERTSAIEDMLFADATPAVAASNPLSPAKPVDVNAFFQRQLEEFLSAPSLPVVKTKVKQTTLTAPVGSDNLLRGTASGSVERSQPAAPSKSPTPIDWSLASEEETKTDQIISNKNERETTDVVKDAVIEGDRPPPMGEMDGESSAPSVDVDEERSSVELIDDDEVGEPLTPSPLPLVNETQTTVDDESDDDGSATPTPDQGRDQVQDENQDRVLDQAQEGTQDQEQIQDQIPIQDEVQDRELQLPQGVNEELNLVSQSQPVYDRMVAIATCLAAHNPKAGLLLEELKKLERK